MTIRQVKEFCDETRQLAAQINAYIDKWTPFTEEPRQPFTPRERRRVEAAEMRLRLARERL